VMVVYRNERVTETAATKKTNPDQSSVPRGFDKAD
jgi:hypothetical protein